MSIVAIIPIALLLAANESLQQQGFGFPNFSVPVYTGASVTHGALHAWDDPVFEAALAAITGVVMEISSGDPITRTLALIQAQGGQWGQQAPDLPVGGDYPEGNHPVVAGTMYRWTDGSMWLVSANHDRAVYGGDPDQYPAVIRRVRDPNVVGPWNEPMDSLDSYRLVNAFTGEPEECTYDDKTWVTSLDYNAFEPGTTGSGWYEKGTEVPVDPPIDLWPAWQERNPDLSYRLYAVGAQVTHNGKRWINTHPSNTYEPGVYGWTEQP